MEMIHDNFFVGKGTYMQLRRTATNMGLTINCTTFDSCPLVQVNDIRWKLPGLRVYQEDLRKGHVHVNLLANDELSDLGKQAEQIVTASILVSWRRQKNKHEGDHWIKISTVFLGF